MAENYQELVEEVMADKSTAEQPAQPAQEQPTDTPPAQEQPNGNPPAQEQPNGNPPAQEQPTDTPPADPKPEDKKPSDFTPQERAEHAFKRQLAKQREKHEAEMKALTENFQKQIDELKKSTAPKPVTKTREDFQTDDEYIDYLVQQRYKAEQEKTEAARAEAEKKRSEEEEQRKQQEEELQQQQQTWVDNVSAAFNGDEKRKSDFFKRVQYCQQRGLGTILDNVPVAADFLMYNPRGPIVFERMLNDRAAFESVFNDRQLNPMDIYYALRKLDEKIAAEQPAQPNAAPTQPNAAPTKPTVPHMGKPGKQAASNATPDIFTDDDEMLKYLRTR